MKGKRKRRKDGKMARREGVTNFEKMYCTIGIL